MDQALGLLALAGYIAAIVSLAAAVTFTVIKIFPTERNPKKGDKSDKSDKSDSNGAESGGRLYRRSKRGAA